MNQAQSLIRIADVSKRYGDHNVRALHDINLEIAPGQFISIMGPSGCGKSTLLNIIGGIDRPSAGKITFEGRDLVAMSDEELTGLRRNHVGFIFQFFNLLATLTVEENVALPLELENARNTDIRAAVKDVLERVGMTARSAFYPSQLSGG